MTLELAVRTVQVLAIAGAVFFAIRAGWYSSKRRDGMQQLVDIYAEAARRRAQENG